MVKTKNNKSLATIIILAMCLVSALVLIVTPIMFLDYTGGNSLNLDNNYGIRAIWGWTGMFGGSFSVENYKNFTLDFNWAAYLTMLAYVVIGFTTYYIGPKKRGYYIFAALVFVILAVMSFTMTSTWISSTTSFSEYDRTVAHLGVGPWISGFFACFSVLGCIYEFRTAKLR